MAFRPKDPGDVHVRSWLRWGLLVMLFCMVPMVSPQAQMAQTVDAANLKTDYRLGVGDKLRITVFGEEDLSGEFEIGGGGTISMPLIGQVPAANLTLTEFEKGLAQRFRAGYLKHPRISAEVLNYRPFFIEGEVQEPGQYPYVNGMTVREAVAIAGGYTYRAKKDHAMIIRRGDATKQSQRVPVNEIVLPGDYLEIPERFF